MAVPRINVLAAKAALARELEVEMRALRQDKEGALGNLLSPEQLLCHRAQIAVAAPRLTHGWPIAGQGVLKCVLLLLLLLLPAAARGVTVSYTHLTLPTIYSV